VEQFNSDLTQENFASTKGARWKVLGSPGGRGGLAYHGESVAAYRQSYEIKTKDDPKSWADLIRLCKVLNQTPPGQLEKALAPVLDIDGALRFLAVDKVMINNDGYWVRSSDYSLYEDPYGRFHLIPQDANETFREVEMMGGGRGGASGERPSGVKLPPFTGADDPEKALLYSLLKVPSLRARYLAYVRDMAEKWLDWDRIGPLAKQLQAVIAADIQTDTRKLDTTENFTARVTKDREETAGRGGPGNPGGPDGRGFGPPPEGFDPAQGGFGPPPGRFGRGGRGGGGGPGGMDGSPQLSLKSFVEQRRAYLLALDDVRKAAKL
jgi:spore coat protein CotH